MELIIKQKLLSITDSFSVYNEQDEEVYFVKSKFWSWGHHFKVYDKYEQLVGEVDQMILTLFPKFNISVRGIYTGTICKHFTFFHDKFDLDYKGWTVEGDWMDWNYLVRDSGGSVIATVSKKVLSLADTYIVNVVDKRYEIEILMLVLTIDATNERKHRSNN